MDYSAIPKFVHCCICKKDPIGVNFASAPLKLKANWAFPTHGNFLNDTRGLAMAFVCSICEDSANPGSIKEAVEFTADNGVLYHEIDWVTRTFKN